jgi:predicted RNase H-like nuclease (RuvC/YqgF family)
MGRRTFGDRSDTTNSLRVLKKQVEKLKIENLRLRKELNKMQQLIVTNDGVVDETAEPVSEPKAPTCTKCESSDTRIFRLKVGTLEKRYLLCDDCGTRKLIKSEK